MSSKFMTRVTGLVIRNSCRQPINNARQVSGYSETTSSKPWKEASSLIIAAKKNSSNQTSQVLPKHDDCDFGILMAKRSSKSSFMANAFVFPGGYVELADFSTKWWAVFEAAGMSRNELSRFGSDIQGSRPPIFTEAGVLMQEEYLSADILPATVALRITAIRETFEETGILLLNRPDHGNAGHNLSKTELKSWQAKIHDNPSSFPEFCLKVGFCPDIWSLKEWSNWLTPPFEQKRFDTMFHICCLDSSPKTISDDNEVSRLEWSSPFDMLDQHQRNKALLMPPQVYELSRLCNFNSLTELKDFASNREKLGVEQWCPQMTILKDGAVITLPGDDFFDTTFDCKDLSLAEMRSRSKNGNRIEREGSSWTAVSNIKSGVGHVTPVLLKKTAWILLNWDLHWRNSRHWQISVNIF